MTQRTTSRRPLRTGMMLLALGGLACGDGAADHDDRREPAQAAAAANEHDDDDDDEGHEADSVLARRGEELFTAKACVGCHTIGAGRLTGPDLASVTERRSRRWILAMITQPDSMLKHDATARQLFMEHATPMANMNVSADEARALYEYLRVAGAAQ